MVIARWPYFYKFSACYDVIYSLCSIIIGYNISRESIVSFGTTNKKIYRFYYGLGIFSYNSKKLQIMFNILKRHFACFLHVYLQGASFINFCFFVIIILNTYIRSSLIIGLNIFLWKQSYENTLYLYFYMEICHYFTFI